MSDLHTNGTANRAPAGAQDDIVATIRHTAWLAPEGESWADRLREAADEIERLRTERRQLIDAFRIVVRDWCPASVRVPILEEARREQ
jgi:hypothetical protein